MVQMGLYTFLRSLASCPALPPWDPFLAFLEEVQAVVSSSEEDWARGRRHCSFPFASFLAWLVLLPPFV